MPLHPLKAALLALSIGGLLAGLVVTSAQGGVCSITTLSSFNGPNGANPDAGLIQGADGNFYGTTSQGGTNGPMSGYGTVFRITPSGTLVSLLSFNLNNGAAPEAALLQTPDGLLYGTTSEGGVSNLGTIFRITTNGALTSLLSFTNGNGAKPYARLLQGFDGNLYGTTTGGGPGETNGTVFKLTTNGVLTTLFTFNFTNGAVPHAGLMQAMDGGLYGATVRGGTNGDFGTLFRITTNGTFSTLFSFSGTNGATPYGGLVQASNGVLYGTTTYGGAYTYGTVFRITTNGVFQSLYSFSGGVDGANPWARLTWGKEGTLCGTTILGGEEDWGSAFQITTNGIFNSLASFSYDKVSPYGALLPGPYGSLYGTSRGPNLKGTVFRLDPAPPRMGSPARAGNGLLLTWNALIGQTYQVQYQTNLAQANWSNLGNAILATNGVMTVSNSPTTDPRSFYRVVLSLTP